MEVLVAINFDDVLRDLKVVEEETTDEKILDEAAAVLLGRIRERFLREVDPEEVPWLPSRAAIARRRRGGTGTLFDTGRLFRSIQQVAYSGGSETKIATDVPYAKYHQSGTRGLPVRRFLGFSEADAQLYEKVLAARIQKALG